MGWVIFELAEVNSRSLSRPNACPHCGSRLLQGWGWEDKLIEDVQFERVTVHRYRCEACGRTFRHYPSGVDRADQSLRVRQAAAVFWGLGGSLHASVALMKLMGVQMSTSSVWRASHAVDRTLRRRLSTKFHPCVINDLGWMVRVLAPLGRVVILKFATALSFLVGVTDAPEPELHILAEMLGVHVDFVRPR
jgi:DNA-directed RNA polymerase subunit RPC12/RpoP